MHGTFFELKFFKNPLEEKNRNRLLAVKTKTINKKRRKVGIPGTNYQKYVNKILIMRMLKYGIPHLIDPSTINSYT